MPRPTLDAFIASARKALVNIEIVEGELAVFDAKGASFNFYSDGMVDSLDMLDVVFYIDQELGVKLAIEKLMHGEEPMTVQNLYDSIRQAAEAPA